MTSLDSGMIFSWNGTEPSIGTGCTSGTMCTGSECIGFCTAGMGLEKESTVTVFSPAPGAGRLLSCPGCGVTSSRGMKPDDKVIPFSCGGMPIGSSNNTLSS